MISLFKSSIRISAFLNKELTEIFRQPRLIFTLVLGPFLIIMLFGIGYPTEGRALRTLFVVGDQNPLAGEVESLAKIIGPAIVYQGMKNDENAALTDLASGRTDIVVVIPDDPFAMIENNQQATFMIYHGEVDPFQIDYVRSVGRIYIDEVNRRILEALATQGQAEVAPGLSGLGQHLGEIPSMDSGVLVRPFTAEVSGLSDIKFTPVGFLTPAVIILLLQHLSITFAALSIIRERRSGIMELFSVAPLTALETLTGKYLSYLLFNALIGALLTWLVVWVLGVPMLGNWTNYIIVLAILLFTSLGVGFAISLISETEIQAVQYSMLFLLMSIFFSGFFLDLRLLRHPMQNLAWVLPATYGIRMLQDVMLRGHSIPLLLFAGISIIGIALFVVNLFFLGRKMKKN